MAAKISLKDLLTGYAAIVISNGRKMTKQISLEDGVFVLSKYDVTSHVKIDFAENYPAGFLEREAFSALFNHCLELRKALVDEVKYHGVSCQQKSINLVESFGEEKI